MNNNICAFNREDKCIALKVCPMPCAFFKTEQQEKASIETAQARLRSLPIKQQKDIAQKYYAGQMPWWDNPT